MEQHGSTGLMDIFSVLREYSSVYSCMNNICKICSAWSNLGSCHKPTRLHSKSTSGRPTDRSVSVCTLHLENPTCKASGTLVFWIGTVKSVEILQNHDVSALHNFPTVCKSFVEISSSWATYTSSHTMGALVWAFTQSDLCSPNQICIKLVPTAVLFTGLPQRKEP